MRVARAAGRAGSASPRWHGLWDRLSLYLPMLIMGALALVTYGIVQRTPGPEAAPDSPLADGQPDYQLENFTLRRYDAQGRLASTLHGTVLSHYPASGMLEVEQARLERQEPEAGVRQQVRAERLRTDDRRSVYHLTGDVLLVQEPLPDTPKGKATPRLTLTGQTLTWHTDQRLLESDRPVRLTRGADTLMGNRLRYDERSGVTDLQGQVRATLVARTARDQ